ncbi:MAG: MOSC domain-containing protein [Gammaproteobacteria bacterium]|jgi:MOSC domain-containing protein YiiM|nr:MOSC domain-containing protein [Gammaproteobacteria bacterium]
MTIVYLNIGMPKQQVDRHGKEFVTGIAKQHTTQALQLTHSGLPNDGSFEVVHGTPDRALHVFSHEHYDFFAQCAGSPIQHCSFGENLCVSGFTEQDVCVGDIWQLGEAIVQVSMPTERCSTIGRRLQLPKMLHWIHEQMMTGYYLRVLQTGIISVKSNIVCIERPVPEWTIDRLNQLLFKQRDSQLMTAACAVEELSKEWKQRAWQMYK